MLLFPSRETGHKQEEDENRFGFSTASISMHAGTDQAFTIGLCHPLSLIMVSFNLLTRLPDYDVDDDASQISEEIPPLKDPAYDSNSDLDTEDEVDTKPRDTQSNYLAIEGIPSPKGPTTFSFPRITRH